MNIDPRFDKLPTDPMGRIERLARDLAWGALNEVWEPSFNLREEARYQIPVDNNHPGVMEQYIRDVWDWKHPRIGILIALEYISASRGMCHILPRAYALVTRPLATTIFISYGQRKSSALALLIKYRLQMLNPTMDIFMDYSGLTIGNAAAWEKRLEDAVNKQEWFISIAAAGSLDRDMIQKEIQWALNKNTDKIIAIRHANFKVPKPPIEPWLQKYIDIQAHIIKSEDAAAYDFCVDSVLSLFR